MELVKLLQRAIESPSVLPTLLSPFIVDSLLICTIRTCCPGILCLHARSIVSRKSTSHVEHEGTSDFAGGDRKVRVRDARGGEKDDIARVEADDEARFVEDELPTTRTVEVARDIHGGGAVAEVERVAMVDAHSLGTEVGGASRERRAFAWGTECWIHVGFLGITRWNLLQCPKSSLNPYKMLPETREPGLVSPYRGNCQCCLKYTKPSESLPSI